jgi:Golgi nucleoside diphosphatase
MMHENIIEHQYPNNSGDYVISATKQRVLSDANMDEDSEQIQCDRITKKNKVIQNKYLKQLIDPDKQSIPTDSSFKGFSFIKRSALSPQNNPRPNYKEEVLSLSRRNNDYKLSSEPDKNIQKRVQLAKL